MILKQIIKKTLPPFIWNYFRKILKSILQKKKIMIHVDGGQVKILMMMVNSLKKSSIFIKSKSFG